MQVLYLTTTGRTSGLPREIEIWYVESDGRIYLLAEHFFKTQWVRNIQVDPRVKVRLGDKEYAGIARVLDRELDREAWDLAQRLGREKYDWGEGLPVEIVKSDA